MNTAHWKRSLSLSMVMGSVIFQGLWVQAMEIPGEVLSPTSIIAPEKNQDCKKTALPIKILAATNTVIQTEEDKKTKPDAIIQALLDANTPEQEIDPLLSKLAQATEQEQPVMPDGQKYALDYFLGLTPLHKAVLEDNEQEAHSLLQQGADPDEPAVYFSFTPRQIATDAPYSPTSQLVLHWPTKEQ